MMGGSESSPSPSRSPSPELKQGRSELESYDKSEDNLSVPQLTDYSEATTNNDLKLLKVQHAAEIKFNEQINLLQPQLVDDTPYKV